MRVQCFCFSAWVELNNVKRCCSTLTRCALLSLQYTTSEKPTLRSDARVRVQLVDVNDERPEFIGFDENGLYPAAVSEEANPERDGEVSVGQLFAIDSDGTSPNNKVRATCAGGVTHTWSWTMRPTNLISLCLSFEMKLTLLMTKNGSARTHAEHTTTAVE